MGFRSYKGPVETLEHAMRAGVVLEITCQECSHSRSMWAWRIYNWRGAKASAGIALKKPVRGFYCKSCRKSASVILTPTGIRY